MTIPDDHPRAESLRMRERLIEGMHKNIVAEAGLIAHGRGEAFDYLLGEKTPELAFTQEQVAVAMLLSAKHPVISVNGNVAALCPHDIVKLSEILDAPLEVNLFYRRPEREIAIKKILVDNGAKTILGLEKEFQTDISEISHLRRIVDRRGIYSADVVLVPLEDGDRTMALRKLGKKVITIDLNPLSRTSLWSNVTIVNNLIRAIPEMMDIARSMKTMGKQELEVIVTNFDNFQAIGKMLSFFNERLSLLAEGDLIDPTKE